MAKLSSLKMNGHTRPVSYGRATNNIANNSIHPTLKDINVIASGNTSYSGFKDDR